MPIPPKHRKKSIRNPLENCPAIILNGPNKLEDGHFFDMMKDFDLEIKDGKDLHIYRPISQNNFGALMLFSHTEKA
jgi:hypothetical protein|tara:strand:- start:347 stop:574 length:228 start_codon:yes stop_codon:yes gene_type:complete